MEIHGAEYSLVLHDTPVNALNLLRANFSEGT